VLIVLWLSRRRTVKTLANADDAVHRTETWLLSSKVVGKYLYIASDGGGTRKRQVIGNTIAIDKRNAHQGSACGMMWNRSAEPLTIEAKGDGSAEGLKKLNVTTRPRLVPIYIAAFILMRTICSEASVERLISFWIHILNKHRNKLVDARVESACRCKALYAAEWKETQKRMNARRTPMTSQLSSKRMRRTCLIFHPCVHVQPRDRHYHETSCITMYMHHRGRASEYSVGGRSPHTPNVATSAPQYGSLAPSCGPGWPRPS
jgi:hypothetical protein